MNSKTAFRPLLVLLALAISAAAKDDCYPPNFYTSLPRDRDYYYGVARDPDTDKARDQAIRNLGKQVTGEVEGWSQDKIDEVAGPCQDKWEVAARVGKLLPASALLSGWEQDAFERCNGFSYVLVRIDKDRVERFVRGSDKFKKDVVAGLAKRLDKVEADVDVLTKRIERLERGLSGMAPDGPSSSERASISKTVSRARADLTAGKPRGDVEKTLASAEDAYSKLEERIRGYQGARDAAEHARLAALRAEKAPELKGLLAAIDSGKWDLRVAGPIEMIYRDAQDYEDLRRFTRSLLARKDAANLKGMQDQVAYQGIVADISLKDDQAMLADGETFLKTYPKSAMYEAVKAEMNGVIMLARLPKNPAPPAAPAPAPAPDPCSKPASTSR
jgi:hypothetical protein